MQEKNLISIWRESISTYLGDFVGGVHLHINDVFIRQTSLVDQSSKMKTVQVFRLFKATQKVLL